MRTTLTIEKDVAVLIKRVQKARRTTFKQVVNDALREGLAQISQPPREREPFQTKSVNAGRCLVGDLDNIGEVLAIAEGDAYK